VTTPDYRIPIPGRPAVFLDRDGTIILDRDYPRDPDGVALLPGAPAAIRELNRHDVPIIIVTNQSGIARGLVTADDYEAVHGRMIELLRAEGASILDAYMCPHLPEITGPCECRKPGTLLYRRAAADHELALERSAYVGDRWRDVAPALTLGGRGILVPSPSTPVADRERAEREAEVVPELGVAVARILAGPGAPA